MKKGRIQCKDIPDLPILEFVGQFDDLGTNWFGIEYERGVQHAMPPGAPDNLALAKMRMLIRRGLVRGCGCGCRGDFLLTEKGRWLLDSSSLTLR